jgi:hypothetical protein
MNQFSKSWRGILPRLTFSALIALSSASAQAQFGGSPGVPIVPPTPVPPTAELVYSRNFASTVSLVNMSGRFYDAPVTAQFVDSMGRVQIYTTYTKRLDTTSFTTDSLGRYNSIDFGNSLTFTAPPSNNVQSSGGSFTLSNLRWDLNPNGTANIWAATSGTGIEPGYLKAWTSPVTRQGNSVVLSTLSMTSDLFNTMTGSLGFDPEGLGYSALNTSVKNMGTLTISAVPEAATWAQLSLGLIGLGALVRRQTAAHKPCQV